LELIKMAVEFDPLLGKPVFVSPVNRFSTSSALSAFLSSLSDASATLNLIGDSTGNDATDWLYRLLAEKLGPALPSVCIRYRLWSDAAQDYGGWTTIQAGASGQRYAVIGGTYTWMYLTANTKTRTSADKEIVIKCEMADWTPASEARLCGHGGGAGSRGWYISVATNGAIKFNWSADGTALTTVTSSVPPFVNGTAYTLRVKFDSDDGTSKYNVKIDYSTDDSANWTNIADSTGAATSTIFATSGDYQIGGYSGVLNWTGKFYQMHVKDGIAGPQMISSSIDSWGSSDTTASQNNAMGGSPTLYVYNGSHAGAGLSYFNDATRFPKMAAISSGPQLTIISTGHNDVAYRGDGQLQTAWTTLMTALKARQLSAGFVVLTQNPRNTAQTTGKNFSEEQRMTEHVLPLMLQRHGVEVIDTYRAFTRAVTAGATLADLVSDGVHPTVGAGVDVWLNEVWRVFRARMLM
jgi:lysophospholipase L1-like esterase